MAGGSSRDDEVQPSGSLELAASLLWKATTGQDVPENKSDRFESYYDFCEAMANASAVQALKIIDRSANRR
jgi:hypothetical protein